MDGLSTIEEIGALHDEMCLDICKQMIQIKKLHVLSKQVVLSLDYIYSHIHNRITISELSEYLGLSESYFSKLFSREMGIPVSEYIMRLKIEKAKNLLQYSDTDIVGIANYLAFSSQSHFISVFKKYEGITPHKFRERYFRTSWGLG